VRLISGPYAADPGSPGHWLYDGLRIQAELETHQFALHYARTHYAAGTAVLDVAAGQGALAKQLLDAGFSVACTSWNAECQVAIPTYRLDLDHPFGPADVGNQRFPLVCCIEIVEHVENPAAFLRSCASLLSDDGRLVLSTPNVESAAARLQWLVRGTPLSFSGDEVRLNRHISMLWREGLEFLIEQAGLQVCEKHMVGRFLLRSRLAVVRRLAYEGICRLFPGEPRGTTRLYVLARSAAGSRRHGPGEFW
jgi:SAM-dependent methyltransferase